MQLFCSVTPTNKISRLNVMSFFSPEILGESRHAKLRYFAFITVCRKTEGFTQNLLNARFKQFFSFFFVCVAGSNRQSILGSELNATRALRCHIKSDVCKTETSYERFCIQLKKNKISFAWCSLTLSFYDGSHYDKNGYLTTVFVILVISLPHTPNHNNKITDFFFSMLISN